MTLSLPPPPSCSQSHMEFRKHVHTSHLIWSLKGCHKAYRWKSRSQVTGREAVIGRLHCLRSHAGNEILPFHPRSDIISRCLWSSLLGLDWTSDHSSGCTEVCDHGPWCLGKECRREGLTSGFRGSCFLWALHCPLSPSFYLSLLPALTLTARRDRAAGCLLFIHWEHISRFLLRLLGGVRSRYANLCPVSPGSQIS